MKKILLFVVVIISLLGCSPDQSVGKEKATPLVGDTLIEPDTDFSNSSMYIDEASGDTIYVDYSVRYVSPEEKNLENYFIISCYSSTQHDESLERELKKWQELEPKAYLETYAVGDYIKYYIALGKYKSRDEVVTAFQQFTDKYPQENINFYSLVH